MNVELRAISGAFSDYSKLLRLMLEAPAQTYEISNKYRFLHIDYVHILQNYPSIRQADQKQFTERMPAFLGIFEVLKKQGLFRLQVSSDQCMLLMKQSTLVRATWFLHAAVEEFVTETERRRAYIEMVNQLLWPYLTEAGRKIYEEVMGD